MSRALQVVMAGANDVEASRDNLLVQAPKHVLACHTTHLLGSLLVALPLLKAGMSEHCVEEGWVEGGCDVCQGAAGLLYPAVPLLKMGCEDVGVGCALGMHQGGALHNALSACQVPLLQVPGIPRPELCKTTATPVMLCSSCQPVCC